jgi:hypothetical protein
MPSRTFIVLHHASTVWDPRPCCHRPDRMPARRGGLQPALGAPIARALLRVIAARQDRLGVENFRCEVCAVGPDDGSMPSSGPPVSRACHRLRGTTQDRRSEGVRW